MVTNPISLLGRRTAGIVLDLSGIIGLETSIVLLAFVVVATVFAFAILNTGMFSSERSARAALGSLEETSAAMNIRGKVIADANDAKTAIDAIKFTVTLGPASLELVDLSTVGTVVSYLDESQGINCANLQSFDGDANTTECSWSANWLIGSGALIEPGEYVELTVTLTDLTPSLTKKKEFTIQVKPNTGPVLMVNRTLPAELKGVVYLQ